MTDSPDSKWLKTYEKTKSLLRPISDLNAYFTAEEIAGQPVKTFSIGKINIPTGNILVCDPLVYINKDSRPYVQTVPTGKYDITVAATVNEDDCARYAAVKVDFSNEEPVSYVEALKGMENLDDFQEGEYFGFNVDAGLGTIIDIKTRDAYLAFEEEMFQKNPDINMYDDFFAAEFEKSYKKHPEFQRDGGDWINWTIPGRDLNVPMFQSGFGDGAYPVYFGYDKAGNVCRLVIQFIDIATAYTETDDEEDDD